MRATNMLVLMSDEHNPKFLGAAGHPFIATPNLDMLAARGTRFTAAYTTCPICVPARAAFAVGRYVHDIGYWDNADGYEGAIPSWHHALRDSGHRVVSIGKLHFRGRPGDDHGFSEEIVPMHIVDGIGDVKGLVRENIPKRKGGDKMAKRAGPGESAYTVYGDSPGPARLAILSPPLRLGMFSRTRPLTSPMPSMMCIGTISSQKPWSSPGRPRKCSLPIDTTRCPASRNA